MAMVVRGVAGVGGWLEESLKTLPALDDVAPPSAHELQLIADEAATTLAALVERGTNASTLRALKGTLRYWSAWHWAVWGKDLPLLSRPAMPVPAETVGIFLAHHWPRRVGARVVISMPERVKARMRALSAVSKTAVVGRRRVAARDASGATDSDVPSLATVRHRVHMLNALHTLAGVGPLPGDHEQVRLLLRKLRVAVANDAPKALGLKADAVKFDHLARMLDALPSTEEGLRDRALLMVQFFGGGRRRAEVMRCRIEDFRRCHDGRMEWLLKRAKGKVATDASAVIARIALPEAVSATLEEWLGVLMRYGATSGPVWRAFAKPKGRPRRLPLGEDQRPPRALGGCLRDAYVTDLLRRLAVAAGVVLQNVTSHSVRHGYVQSMLDAGVSAQDVMGMTLHKSVQSFVGYSGGAPREAETVGDALAAKMRT